MPADDEDPLDEEPLFYLRSRGLSAAEARRLLVQAFVDEVLALFEAWGPQQYDEEVSQLDHALQTAALARSEGATDNLRGS